MDPLGLLILRLTFGTIFVFHGLHQFFGWFGGGKMVEVMQRLGLRPSRLWASLCGLGNLLGGGMLLFGIFTFVGCALIITVMMVAMLTIKKRSGFWERDGGYEYNLAVIGVATAIGITGPGSISLDAAVVPGLIRPELFFLALLCCLVVGGVGLMARPRVGP
ncbi:MAG: DoxX family membrane protein [Deltaproteobacteria bacterium]|nr:DoxX family membrane protein [Deltaproteobacteria bacterium]